MIHLAHYAPFYAILSGIIVLIGAPFYAVDIFKGKTKPERTTWFIWSVLGVIAFLSQHALHARWSLVYSGLDALGSLIVFGLSLKYGVGGWTVLDRIALIVATIGVAVALVAHYPLVAILGIILADCAGAALTIRKTYHNPDSETSITWFGVGTSALFGALSVGRFRPALLLYPLYLAIVSYGVLIAKQLGHMAKRLPLKRVAEDVT
jgi:hypothetical protein